MTKPSELPSFGNLHGLKVVVHGHTVAAPFAGCMMAEHGATVIFIESAAGPELARSSPKPYGFLQERRNQLGLNLNIPTPEGKEILFSLLEWADIFIEAMKGGTYAEWGLTDEVLWEHNPQLVIVHISGYGQTGLPEYVSRASYDMIGQAFGGLMYLNGMPEPNPPLKAAQAVSDYYSAYMALFGALAGYINAQRTGRGESVDISQFEATWKVQWDVPLTYFRDGRLKERVGNQDAKTASLDVFKCKDGEYCAVSVAMHGPVQRALPLLGLAGDPDYPPDFRAAYWAEPRGVKFHEALKRFCEEHTAAEVESIFGENGIPASRVYNTKTASEHPHMQAREVFVEWDDPQFGKLKGVNVLPKMKCNPGRIWRGAPFFGGDNDDILEELGFSNERIEEFYQKGTIKKTPPNGGYRV